MKKDPEGTVSDGLDKLHEPGERVAIAWPGGPYDFVIEFGYAERVWAEGWEGWLVLHGMVVEPEGPEHRAYRAFYVHPADQGGYAMIPFRGKWTNQRG